MFNRSNAQRPLVAFRGFTLVEVLVAIGVIAILATIAAVSIRAVMGGAKERNTRLALENALSLQAEYENTSKMPTSVRRACYAWNGDDILATVQAMEAMRQIPKNKEMLEKMSAEDLVPADISRVPAWDTVANYAIGDITRLGTTLYRALTANTGQNPSATPAAWIALPQVMTLADGWGRPIHCGGTALRLDQPYNAATRYAAGSIVTDGVKSYRCIAANQGQAVTDTDYWIEVSANPVFLRQAPANRIVWVSGGIDGDIMTDDDNLYSFEN